AERMAALEAEVELLRGGGRKSIVRVDSTVTFAMHWLIPRLASFHTGNPGVQIQLATSNGPIDLSARVDLHIRRDAKEFAGIQPEAFVDEYSILVCGERMRKKASLANLRRCPRIAARSRPDLWPQWGAHHGFAAGDLAPTLELDNTILAIQAAVEGLGVMVVPEIFVAGMIANNALLALDAKGVRTGSYSILKRAR